jgi:hypothetical protein
MLLYRRLPTGCSFSNDHPRCVPPVERGEKKAGRREFLSVSLGLLAMSYTFPIRLRQPEAFGGPFKMTVSSLGLLLQETPPPAGNASMVRIIAGVLALILVVIVIVRRKRGAKKEEEDEF